MALYGGSGGGRTGPYWRRQMGTTLPGEWTAAELAARNAQLAKLGLQPLGGPAPRMASPVGAGGFSQIPEGSIPGLGSGMAGHAQINVGPAPGAPPPPGMPQGRVVGAAPQGTHPFGGGLNQLQLPQLLALRALLHRAAGGAGAAPAPQLARPVAPPPNPLRSVLAGLGAHTAQPSVVQVRPHTRMIRPRGAFPAGY